MSKPISRLWFLGPPFAIFISMFVYYWKFQWARNWVDEKFPWVADNVGERLPAFEQQDGTQPLRRVKKSETPAPLAVEIREPVAAPPNVLTPPPPPSFIAADGSVDLAKLEGNKTYWPSLVKLTTPKEFPAVVNGKVVGKISVPAGTEARLVGIKNGQLGLEYQGGGAWTSANETDLAERVPH